MHDVLVCVYVKRYTLRLWVHPECIRWRNCLAELFIVCNLNFPAQPSNANTHIHWFKHCDWLVFEERVKGWLLLHYRRDRKHCNTLAQWVVNMSDSPLWAASAYFFQKWSGFKSCQLLVSCCSCVTCLSVWEWISRTNQLITTPKMFCHLLKSGPIVTACMCLPKRLEWLSLRMRLEGVYTSSFHDLAEAWSDFV